LHPRSMRSAAIRDRLDNGVVDHLKGLEKRAISALGKQRLEGEFRIAGRVIGLLSKF
jgi:hypothetical protein